MTRHSARALPAITGALIRSPGVLVLRCAADGIRHLKRGDIRKRAIESERLVAVRRCLAMPVCIFQYVRDLAQGMSERVPAAERALDV